MRLSVFKGFSQDMVLDLTGITASQLKSYRESKTVKPKRTSQGFLYSFQDVLTLKLVSQLLKMNVSPSNVKSASKYFHEIDPSKCLLNYKLYIREDNKEILFLGEASETVSASRWGQLIIDKVVRVVPVGEAMEEVRNKVIELDASIKRGASQSKLIPFREALKKHHGLG